MFLSSCSYSIFQISFEAYSAFPNYSLPLGSPWSGSHLPRTLLDVWLHAEDTAARVGCVFSAFSFGCKVVMCKVLQQPIVAIKISCQFVTVCCSV